MDNPQHEEKYRKERNDERHCGCHPCAQSNITLPVHEETQWIDPNIPELVWHQNLRFDPSENFSSFGTIQTGKENKQKAACLLFHRVRVVLTKLRSTKSSARLLSAFNMNGTRNDGCCFIGSKFRSWKYFGEDGSHRNQEGGQPHEVVDRCRW